MSGKLDLSSLCVSHWCKTISQQTKVGFCSFEPQQLKVLLELGVHLACMITLSLCQVYEEVCLLRDLQRDVLLGWWSLFDTSNI